MPQSEEETDKTCGTRNYLHQSSVIHDGRDSETRLEVNVFLFALCEQRTGVHTLILKVAFMA
jgi:hypothetical protein